MAHLALDRALPASWTDEVLQAHRQRQSPRELLFSNVVELITPVCSSRSWGKELERDGP